MLAQAGVARWLAQPPEPPTCWLGRKNAVVELSRPPPGPVTQIKTRRQHCFFVQTTPFFLASLKPRPSVKTNTLSEKRGGTKRAPNCHVTFCPWPCCKLLGLRQPQPSQAARPSPSPARRLAQPPWSLGSQTLSGARTQSSGHLVLARSRKSMNAGLLRALEFIRASEPRSDVLFGG